MALRILPCRHTVPFEERDESPLETASRIAGGSVSSRRWVVATADKAQFIKEMLGYTEVVGGNTVIHRPHVYTFVGKTVTAKTAGIKPFGDRMDTGADRRFAVYATFEIEISYDIPQHTTQESEAYQSEITITETIQPASEFTTVNIEGLYWKHPTMGPQPMDALDAPGRINHLSEWVIEIRNALFLPAGVWGYPGYVNKYPVYSRRLNFWFPPETLHCSHPTVVKEETYDATTFAITLRFLYKNNGLVREVLGGPFVVAGWNHFGHHNSIGAYGTTSYERICDNVGNIKFSYPRIDFRNIVP